jgi:hypothetical protein
MKEIVFRIGLLFFCLSTIANAGMGVPFESIIIRSTVVFFIVVSVSYLMVYAFSRSQESDAKIKTKIVNEILNDDEMSIINSRIEERARFLMEQELSSEKQDKEEETKIEQE